MRSIGTIAIALFINGMAAAQGYYPYPYGGMAPAAPMLRQPMPQPAPPASNARVPQLLAYPTFSTPAATDPALQRTPLQDLPTSPPSGDEGAARIDEAPAAPDSSDTLSELPPEDPQVGTETDSTIPTPYDPNYVATEIIKPTPAPPLPSAPANSAVQQPVFMETQPSASSPETIAETQEMVIGKARVLVVQAPPPPPPPTLLGHFFFLEKLHTLVNYAVPVHYPKQQVRGPWWYGDAYFSLLWAKGQSTPPLILSQSGRVLVGGGELQFDNNQRIGGRFTLGHWLNCAQTLGLEVSFLTFAQREPTFVGINVVRAQPIEDLDRAELSALSRFGSAEVNLRHELKRGVFGRLDCLAGIHGVQLDETLNITGQSPFDNSIDNFRTENTVIAAQLGLDGELQYGCCSVRFWGKAGAGNVHQRLIMSNSNGVLEPTASGTFTRNRPALLLDGGVFAGVQLTNCCRFSAGYSIIYLADVARPGDQIDNVSTSFVRGDSSYWVQGINGGFEFRF